MVQQSGDDCADDKTISTDAKLLRRIPPNPDYVVIDDHGAIIRPSANAFRNHPDGTGTSVDISEDDWGPDDTLRGHEEFGLITLTAQQVRDAGLGIVRAPIAGNDHHAYLQGKTTKGRRNQLSRAAEWIRKPDLNS